MITKKDYFIAAVVGVLTAVFIMPVLWNLGRLNFRTAIFTFIVIPVLWMLGVWLGKFLGQWLKFFNQFGKYAATGFFNASINFGILNLLSIITGTTSGFVVGGVSAPGFIAAAINSYFWNKFWVFSDQEKLPVNLAETSRFALITILGLIFTVGIVIYTTTYIHPLFGASPSGWLNISNVIASAIVLLWNFLGYKFFAFSKKI